MTLNLALALVVLCILFNAVVFSIYWIDKRAARNGSWRVSETTLLLLAFAGGSLGAVTAQRLLRHKAHKEPFRTILAAIVTLHVCMGVVLILAVSRVLESIWTLLSGP
jgi:uncharacterized membrane protein YsdA (DUF1294 family)